MSAPRTTLPSRAACGLAALAMLLVVPALAAQDVPYGVGTWEPDSTGNQRAVVRVARAADAVWVRIPWRRRDAEPWRKDVIVVDARTGVRIRNVARVAVNREFGDIVFQPSSGAGDYDVYYLRYLGSYRSPYPRLTYAPPQATADSGWLAKHGLVEPESAGPHLDRFPRARTVAFQSASAFDSPYPMEVIATGAETRALLARHPASPYLVFPEDRGHPVRMTTDLPAVWARRGPGGPFHGTAAAGEFYVFQLGVWAARARLSNVNVAFTGLRSVRGGPAIPAAAFRCFNLGGVDWLGRDFTRVVNVDSGAVQPLWCGVQVPRDAPSGRYRGRLTVSAEGRPATAIALELGVSSDTIRNAGDDDPARLSRLRWLDSRLAEDDGVVPPYTPVAVHGDTVEVLGRLVVLGSDGLPAGVASRFAIEMTRFADAPRALLTGPVALVAADDDGRVMPPAAEGVRFVKLAQGAAAWEARSHAGALDFDVRARMEFDGNIEYRVAVTARTATRVGDIRLEIPFDAEVARYVMGLGRKGGARPDRYEWKWDVHRNQDGAWVGDVNAGLQFTLR
ncbi:MAG TPA: glycoside hydrolase domain-containing protein, partial [Gemmatimonadales bacterium]|nr:glycoside hydrolase domain-containing protein [Gemmatimonadales bacterium]